jgi:hypothetical protein
MLSHTWRGMPVACESHHRKFETPPDPLLSALFRKCQLENLSLLA